MVTRLSLSLASAQAVFAIVGIMFVTILRKMKVEASSATPKAVVSENEVHDIIKLYLKRCLKFTKQPSLTSTCFHTTVATEFGTLGPSIAAAWAKVTRLCGLPVLDDSSRAIDVSCFS